MPDSIDPRSLSQMSTASSGEAKESEDLPLLGADLGLYDNTDFMDSLYRCLEPVGGEFLCRYNTTDAGVPPTPSCANLSNGSCICVGTIGCFRGQYPTEGSECFERCRELYEPAAETEDSAR